MYNLFVTAEEKAWNKLHYEFDRSRFLEYTNESIAKKFSGLTDRQIDILKSFPCLFAYEGESKNVRFGRLTSIKERGRLILIEYKFFPEVRSIRYSRIKPISRLLDIRNWEMNRTHWAVKDEDLLERLHSQNILNRATVENYFAAITRSSPAKPRVSSSTVRTIKGFIAKILTESKDKNREVYFRGHSNRQAYKLEPSLFRKDQSGNYLFKDNEHILYRELLVSNLNDFSSDVYTFDRLVRMQHYSLPTRLLDITSNPLIALYFACKSSFGQVTNGKITGEVEGEVVIISVGKAQIKYFDSDTVSCIANLARLPQAEKNKIKLGSSKAQFNKQLSIKRLIHFIREEKSFFDPRIEPADMQKIICVKGKKSNDRIAFQSGAFLLYGLDSVLDEKGTPDIQVNRISVANKIDILSELDQININESTVFPYIENSAKYVANKFKFGN